MPQRKHGRQELPASLPKGRETPVFSARQELPKRASPVQDGLQVELRDGLSRLLPGPGDVPAAVPRRFPGQAVISVCPPLRVAVRLRSFRCYRQERENVRRYRESPIQFVQDRGPFPAKPIRQRLVKNG